MDPLVQGRASFNYSLPEQWDARYDGSSRCSSYTVQYPSVRSNEYEAMKPSSSSYASWGRENVSTASSMPWQQQSRGMMFSYPPNLPHFKDANINYRSPNDHLFGKDSVEHCHLPKPPGFPEQHSHSAPSLSSSDASQSNRGPKRHVKSACANCKKAHLACDASRPCPRCVQTGKIDGCYDVPQKRKGRPRLRGDNMRKPSREALTKPLSAKPLMIAQDPRAMNGLPYLEFHPDMTFGPDLYNEYTLLPIAFLDLDLKFVRINQYFKGIFGDLRQELFNQRLDLLVETPDYGHLQELRGWIRHHAQMVMSTSFTPIQPLDCPDISKVPTPDIQNFTNIVKAASKKDTIRFRLGDGISYPLPVEISVTKGPVVFVCLTLPPLRLNSSILQSHPQPERLLNQLSTQCASNFDPSRGLYGRSSGGVVPLSSPDNSSYFSISPSSSSQSFSSTTSSILGPNSRHTSIASHRSYELPLGTGSNPANQQSQMASITLGSPHKHYSQNMLLSGSQQSSARPSSPQLAPIQNSVLNSRTLPPLPSLGSPSTSHEASNTEARSQQNTWPSSSSDTASQGDKKDIWRGENSVGKRTRLDVKDLAA